ncbi:hypothetical protein AB0P19_06945 [Microbacterium oleivorans]|uniref:hypothetical protein n=1 Tax=Microbacterium oleivorans TaxID=273677 RepID=UPI00340DFDB5
MSTEVQYQVSVSLPSGISSARRVRAGIEVGRSEPYVGPLTKDQRKAIEADPYLTIAPVQDGEENAEAGEAVANAQAEAEGILEAARDEAKSIVETAQTEADQLKADATKKGEDIVKSAKELAKDITDKAKEEAKVAKEATKATSAN